MTDKLKDDSVQMRLYHNYIKGVLLEQVSNSGKTLLDIGVGRGGDLHKWNRYGITKVVGVDVNEVYIKDAIKRYKSSKYRKDYKFYVINDVDDIDYGKFDNVSCMFAFHYFCANNELLEKVINKISCSLNDGGYFIGTVPNGEYISKLQYKNNIYKNQAGCIKREYKNIFKIGDTIKFALSGTLYFGDNSVSTEYLVFKEKVQEVANKYGLSLIFWKGFDEYRTAKYSMNEDFKVMSDLNSAFMFKKIN